MSYTAFSSLLNNITDSIIDRRIKMEEVTSGELLFFLKNFQKTMEQKFEETKGSMEEKIEATNVKLDTRLNSVDEDLKKVNKKIDVNEERSKVISKRMEIRLIALEEEMRKRETIKNISDNLRELHRQTLGEDWMARDTTEEGREEARMKHDKPVHSNQRQTETREEPSKEQKEAEERLKTKKNVKYSRRRITEDDLTVLDDDKEEDPVIPDKYKSTWATQMEEELRTQAARQNELEKRRGEASERKIDDNNRDIWKELGIPEKKKKIRRPVIEHGWFGEDKDNLSSSSSSEDSQEGDSQWTEIERQKINQKKRREKRRKRLLKMEETATKMTRMIGIGPILDKSIDFFEKKTNDKKEALKLAAKEYLEHYLDYDREELKDLNVIDTKRATKDNIVYLVLDSQEAVKEIHYRRAASQNDDLTTRDYIPPPFYERYMAVVHKATERRSVDKMLKTQIRWGCKDVEIYLKEKGSKEPMKKADLREFMGKDTLPDFDFDLQKKWIDRREQPVRKKLNFTRAALPSLEKTVNCEASYPGENPLTRQRSDSSRHGVYKKHRTLSTSGSPSPSDMEQEEEEAFDTPAGLNNTTIHDEEF